MMALNPFCLYKRFTLSLTVCMWAKSLLEPLDTRESFDLVSLTQLANHELGSFRQPTLQRLNY